jgi:hypothetical protein
MPKLKFYDLKKKKSFESDKYKLITKKTSKGTKYFAVCKNPSNTESWRIVSKEFYDKFKK